MNTVLASYETLFIINPALEESGLRGVVEKFSTLISANGEITQIDEWGKRRLAYPINDINEGYYVLINFNSRTDFISELERIYNITDDIMRSLVIAK